MIEICPLSMMSGKPAKCDNRCRYCPPQDFESIKNDFQYLECLNLPNDMFGEGLAKDGLSDVALSLQEVARAMKERAVV